jgi:hypothetical protein
MLGPAPRITRNNHMGCRCCISSPGAYAVTAFRRTFLRMRMRSWPRRGIRPRRCSPRGPAIPLTRECLGVIIGTARPSAAIALQELDRKGFITQHRGGNSAASPSLLSGEAASPQMASSIMTLSHSSMSHTLDQVRHSLAPQMRKIMRGRRYLVCLRNLSIGMIDDRRRRRRYPDVVSTMVSGRRRRR